MFHHFPFMFLIWFVVLPVGLVMLVVYGMARIFRKSDTEERAARDEEARLNHELVDSMDRLERRIESLETILHDHMTPTGEEDAPPPPPHNKDQR
ncbi:envelope stress response membrane protein PspB [Oceanidesulfovibrio marinus]|uniref:Envelope stress response membrane protein PspB n=1 Tax=Oceanidesulfovibrio marinus TaxID=370038 RepID=A0A6P1ZL61_9BACT|nr:envelope stress response membrane protein PspB [Oceanidesulfovibrio marinus]QJT10049.1 envelope stress response membrane protein PspB [Oceanidesulfovibrio marinus]TVM35834.1 hypothetical protein DQK91_04010 [Oceanidesulfovibrio marinus]